MQCDNVSTILAVDAKRLQEAVTLYKKKHKTIKPDAVGFDVDEEAGHRAWLKAVGDWSPLDRVRWSRYVEYKQRIIQTTSPMLRDAAIERTMRLSNVEKDMFAAYVSNPTKVDHGGIHKTILKHKQWRTLEPIILYHGGPFLYDSNRLLSTSFDPCIALKYSKTPLQLNKILVPKNTPFFAFSSETEQFTAEEVLLPLCLQFKLEEVDIVDFPYFETSEDYTYVLKPVILATWILGKKKT